MSMWFNLMQSKEFYQDFTCSESFEWMDAFGNENTCGAWLFSTRKSYHKVLD